MCGYAFSQNYQNLKTIYQFPTCASPSKSHTGILDPDKSITLDDTALLDISCRTLTKKTLSESLEGENERVGNEAEWENERVDTETERESERVDTETEGENERVYTETEWENERVYTETERESERVDTETEGENERVDTETEGENERVHNESIKISFHVGKGSFSQPSKGSIKWDKRSEVVNAKRRLQYKLNPISKRLINQRYYQSQPEIRSQKVLHAYHANPSHAKRRMQDAYHANPSPIKEKARQRRREAYSTNPSPIKEKARQRAREAYSTNPSPIKEKARQRRREAYSTNPSPIKEKARQRAREAYSTNPSPIKEKARQRRREAYSTNPSPIKEKARQRRREAYSTNPSPIKDKARQRARDDYRINPSPKRRRARDANPFPIKRRALDSYRIDPSPVKRRALAAYYKKHELNKSKRRQLYKDNRVLDRRHIIKLVACSVMNKYSKIFSDVPATTAAYIYRLTKQIKGRSYVDKHTTAQYLVNTCKHYRHSHEAVFIKQFHNLRTAVLAVLAKATEATTDDEVSDVLCGQSLHTSTSESFFPETTYNSAAFDEDGNVLRHKFPSHNTNASGSGTDTWKCSAELCTIPPKESVNQVICKTYTNIAESDPADAQYFIQLTCMIQSYRATTKLAMLILMPVALCCCTCVVLPLTFQI